MANQARQADQLYLLLRCLRDCSLKLGRAAEGTPQAVSPWSTFNGSVTDVPQRSTIGYLPVIPSSTTELATLHETMTRSCTMATALNQEHVIIMVDQAICCKAQEIRWKHPSKFQMSCSGWVPSTQLPPSWQFLASLLVTLHGLQDDSLKNTLLLLLLLLLL